MEQMGRMLELRLAAYGSHSHGTNGEYPRQVVAEDLRSNVVLLLA